MLFNSNRSTLSFKMIAIITLILTSSLTITFYIMGKRYEQLLYSQIKSMSKILMKQIQITGEWLMDHHSVYVKLSSQSQTSPIKKESLSLSFKEKNLRQINIAQVFDEMSGYAEKDGAFWYNLTSLKPLNPNNGPDKFEEKALKLFAKDKNIKELHEIETIDKNSFSRYIVPLYMEEKCLQCHANQGIDMGDLKGAISITLPADNMVRLINTNKRNTILATFIISAIIILCIFFTLNLIIIKPIIRLSRSIEDYGKEKILPDMDINSCKELEDLSCSFRKMAEELNEHHTTLDSKVKDTTKDLKIVNSKLIEANNKLADINVKKSDFIACISHEMRTPLTAIKGAMEYISERMKGLESHDKDSEELKEFFDIVKNNAERLIRIVNNTIDIERIELGKLEIQLTSLYLTYLILDVVKGFKTIFNEKSIEVNVNLESELKVSADGDRVKQVLINLLNNAVNFSPNEGKIIVNGYRENGWGVTEIVDHGTGINITDKEMVFQKYYKKGRHRGSGLGLAISKGIMDAHNGEIGFKNGDNKGCTFYFKLPIIEEKNDEKHTYSR